MHPTKTYPPRLTGWLLFSLLLLAIVAVVAPQQIGVHISKLAQVTQAVVLAYWIDRAVFPYARPDSYLTTQDWREFIAAYGPSDATANFPVAAGYTMLFAACMLRRAIVMLAVVLGVCLGL